MEAFRRYNSGGKSRFLVSLLKKNTKIALTSLTQVRAQAFYQLKVTLFAVGQQAENFPLNVPFLLYRRVRIKLLVGHFATFLGHFQHRHGGDRGFAHLDRVLERFAAQT